MRGLSNVSRNKKLTFNLLSKVIPFEKNRTIRVSWLLKYTLLKKKILEVCSLLNIHNSAIRTVLFRIIYCTLFIEMFYSDYGWVPIVQLSDGSQMAIITQWGSSLILPLTSPDCYRISATGLMPKSCVWWAAAEPQAQGLESPLEFMREFLDRHPELSRDRTRPCLRRWCWQIETPDMVFV